MTREGMSFEEALKGAQRLGYAEADPTADVEGIDACRKICILADIIFGSHVYPENVYTKGISDIRMEDAKILRRAGGRVKLLGVAKKEKDGKLFITTQPFALLKDNPLAAANDVFNAVAIKADCRGDMMFYGRGAGSLPTASAVVNDIIEYVKANGCTLYPAWGKEKEDYLADIHARPMKFYVCVKEKPETVKAVFGDETLLLSTGNETAFVTGTTNEKDLANILKSFTVLSTLPVME